MISIVEKYIKPFERFVFPITIDIGASMIKKTVTEFTTVVWSKLAEETAVSFRMTAEEATRFKEGNVAKLIAAIPFLAGCDQSERTALAHLSIYLIASRGSRFTFDHNAADNVSAFDRLHTIMNFSGGDEKVIERGMALLSLVMLEGYNIDRYKDSMDGNYNPLNDGSWDYDAMKTHLKSLIDSCPDSEMDALIDYPAPFSFWQPEF